MQLADAVEEKRFAAGAVIIEQGADGDLFYILDSGECDVYVDGVDGKPVKHYDSGAHFGELALMYNAPRAASVQAKDASVRPAPARR